MAGMVEETLEQRLKRHEDALVACMAEITRLREENTRLRVESKNRSRSSNRNMRANLHAIFKVPPNRVSQGPKSLLHFRHAKISPS